MLRRPNTGVTTQNIYEQALHKNMNQFLEIKALYSSEKKPVILNTFIPTLKKKRQDRNIRSSTIRPETMQRREPNQKTISNHIIQKNLQSEVRLGNNQEMELNVSKIRQKNYFDYDDSIQELNDFMVYCGDKNNFFEKHILESTQNQSQLDDKKPNSQQMFNQNNKDQNQNKLIPNLNQPVQRDQKIMQNIKSRKAYSQRQQSDLEQRQNVRPEIQQQNKLILNHMNKNQNQINQNNNDIDFCYQENINTQQIENLNNQYNLNNRNNNQETNQYKFDQFNQKETKKLDPRIKNFEFQQKRILISSARLSKPKRAMTPSYGIVSQKNQFLYLMRNTSKKQAEQTNNKQVIQKQNIFAKTVNGFKRFK